MVMQPFDSRALGKHSSTNWPLVSTAQHIIPHPCGNIELHLFEVGTGAMRSSSVKNDTYHWIFVWKHSCLIEGIRLSARLSPWISWAEKDPHEYLYSTSCVWQQRTLLFLCCQEGKCLLECVLILYAYCKDVSKVICSMGSKIILSPCVIHRAWFNVIYSCKSHFWAHASLRKNF